MCSSFLFFFFLYFSLFTVRNSTKVSVMHRCGPVSQTPNPKRKDGGKSGLQVLPEYGAQGLLRSSLRKKVPNKETIAVSTSFPHNHNSRKPPPLGRAWNQLYPDAIMCRYAVPQRLRFFPRHRWQRVIRRKVIVMPQYRRWSQDREIIAC
ncbi:hypothetical protein V8F33_012733 [Rhypophila sp. PSN 637]